MSISLPVARIAEFTTNGGQFKFDVNSFCSGIMRAGVIKAKAQIRALHTGLSRHASPQTVIVERMGSDLRVSVVDNAGDGWLFDVSQRGTATKSCLID